MVSQSAAHVVKNREKCSYLTFFKKVQKSLNGTPFAPIVIYKGVQYVCLMEDTPASKRDGELNYV
ncbi:MAG: hypothetical protein CMJ38_05730 [Phycisphaerae bacterium]|nr:hypothetical protein [Phycisphaerae bacterium]